MIGDFHFLRPWWLAALIPLAVIVWALRRASDASTPWRGIVADHLLPYLVQGAVSKKRLGSWWLVVASTGILIPGIHHRRYSPWMNPPEPDSRSAANRETNQSWTGLPHSSESGG